MDADGDAFVDVLSSRFSPGAGGDPGGVYGLITRNARATFSGSPRRPHAVDRDSDLELYGDL